MFTTTSVTARWQLHLGVQEDLVTWPKLNPGGPLPLTLNLPLKLTISINVSHLFQLPILPKSKPPTSPLSSFTICSGTGHFSHLFTTATSLSKPPTNYHKVFHHLELRHLPLNHICGLSRVKAHLPLKQESSFQVLSTASHMHMHLSWNVASLLLCCIGFHITNHSIPHFHVPCFLSLLRI